MAQGKITPSSTALTDVSFILLYLFSLFVTCIMFWILYESWIHKYFSLALNSLCSWGWPWITDLSAFISQVLGIQVCTTRPSFNVVLGIEPNASCMLSKQSINCAIYQPMVLNSTPSMSNETRITKPKYLRI